MSAPTSIQPGGSQPTILLPDPSTVIGPIFLGNSFNWMLMGLLTAQVYVYWRKFSRDRLRIKALVYLILVLDVAQTAFGTQEAWWFSIKTWGNLSALQGGPWTTVISPIMCGITIFIVLMSKACPDAKSCGHCWVNSRMGQSDIFGNAGSS
ncbi:hypothetical protein DFH07DRAFT_934863 [Mycena maculata]|uniref:Uncharacterized protein n=1 Tax=Mycena maculata TaxID=230809 RepID=A0AAD7KJZ7_9AGAR|nr:hypothetical protein DFH07DRAFT_934863 [Mycena maculata]